MPIILTIFENPEIWLKKNLPATESTCIFGVIRTSKVDLERTTHYQDVEEGGSFGCNLADHVKALQLLCEKIGRTLFVGGLKSPFELTDPGNWDVEVVDAYYQLVVYGEVLYG